jgi:DNA-binding XRE family transcriptional regulator
LVKEENKPFAELLGKLLRRRRIEMDMTQAELAWITKMSEEGYGGSREEKVFQPH